MEPVLRYPQTLEPGQHPPDSGESPRPDPPSVAFTLSRHSTTKKSLACVRPRTPPRPRRLWSPPAVRHRGRPRHVATGTTSVRQGSPSSRDRRVHRQFGHHRPGAREPRLRAPPRTPPARRAACERSRRHPAEISRGNSALHAVKMGSVKPPAAASPARHAAVRRLRCRADADAVTTAYVPIRDTAPRNIHPISFSMRERVSTRPPRCTPPRSSPSRQGSARLQVRRHAASPSPSPSPSRRRVGQASKPSARMRAKNQALVVICPSEMAAAAPGRPTSTSWRRDARPPGSRDAVAAPVRHPRPHRRHAVARCPTNTPSAAFERGEERVRARARSHTFARAAPSPPGRA